MPSPRVDLTGQRFGRWVVVSFAGSNRWRGSLWDVICDCGARRTVLGESLKSGASVSCGCWGRTAHGESRKVRARAVEAAGEKLCSVPECLAGAPQPLSHFHKKSGTIEGRSNECRTCCALRRAKNVYGVDKRRLMADQNGRCANDGCRRLLKDDHKPSVDHCHASGAVRGVLCGNCNTALGLLGESDDRMRGLRDYAAKHRHLTHGGSHV